MKHKLLELLLITGCFISTKTTAQFYNAFTDASISERETAAIESGDSFVFGYTKTNDARHFHKNILLIKTSNTGKIVWSKNYDAGAGISLHLIEMISTMNNEIVISCIIGPDNNFDSMQRCLLKLTTGGAVVWCKKYTGGNPYDSKGLAQLTDSSFVFSSGAGITNPAILQADDNGKLIGAVKVSNRQFVYVHSITATGNAADIIVGNNNKVSINFKTKAVTAQQQYKTSNQFTGLLSTRCRNGDIIYLAGRTQGGILSGTSRIFRTTTNGTLVWAKNINAYFNTSGSPFAVFDIVQQVYIHEDINGNIIACVMEESTHELIIMFDPNGRYLYNRALEVPLSFIAETSSGTYLNTAPPSTNTSGKTIFANRFLSPASNCDSSVIVKITNGTDSAAVLDKLIFKPAQFSTSDIAINARNVSIQPSVFCDNNTTTKSSDIKDEKIDISVLPNPAVSSILIKSKYNLPCRIYDINGSLKIISSTNHTIQVASLYPGTYFAAVTINDKLIRKIFIKQ